MHSIEIDLAVNASDIIYIAILYINYPRRGLRKFVANDIILRHSLNATLQQSIREVLQLQEPENDDFNLDLHDGDAFVRALTDINRNERMFAVFKSENFYPEGVDTWEVFFRFWYLKAMQDNLVVGLTYVRDRHPGVFALYEPMAALDNSIGSPYLVPVLGVHATPVLVRYIIDAALVLEQLGWDALSGGRHLLEVGGGYGGMAVVLMHLLPDIARYSIVDLPAAGELQSKYTQRCGIPSTRLRVLSSSQLTPVSSDVLLSFYAISELRRDIVERYLRVYVAGAAHGYLQLNYDEDYGLALTNFVQSSQLVVTAELYGRIRALHPLARMVPAPMYTKHARIVW